MIPEGHILPPPRRLYGVWVHYKTMFHGANGTPLVFAHWQDARKLLRESKEQYVESYDPRTFFGACVKVLEPEDLEAFS